MQNIQEIEAAVLELLDEMQGELGDAHEIQLKLRQTLDSMRAVGMPLPDDLVRLERELSSEFMSEAEASPTSGAQHDSIRNEADKK
jgi:hypothetical protein